jgi:hypothetical protein
LSIQQTLTARHRAGDATPVEIEQASEAGGCTAASIVAQAFIDPAEAHFRCQQQLLFPALDMAAPLTAGATAVMRSEHAQMREPFSELRDALAGCGGFAAVVDSAAQPQGGECAVSDR